MMRTERRRAFFRAKETLGLSLAIALALSAWGEQVELENGVMLNYVVVDGGVHVGNTNAPFAAVLTDTRGQLVIPETIEGKAVTEIGPYAFSGCSLLTEVVVPASVANIGEAAFMDCAKLEATDLPKGLVCIGKNSFSGCSSMRLLTLPDSLRVVNNGAFAECDAIRSVIIPGGIVVLGDPVSFIYSSGASTCSGSTSSSGTLTSSGTSSGGGSGCGTTSTDFSGSTKAMA